MPPGWRCRTCYLSLPLSALGLRHRASPECTMSRSLASSNAHPSSRQPRLHPAATDGRVIPLLRFHRPRTYPTSARRPVRSKPRLPPPTNTTMPVDSWSCILQKSQTSLEALTTIAHRRPTDTWAEYEHARLDTWTTRLHGSDSQPTNIQIGFRLDAIAAEATLQVLDALIINLVLCKLYHSDLSVCIACHDILSLPIL
jgi:hypothetical protein